MRTVFHRFIRLKPSSQESRSNEDAVNEKRTYPQVDFTVLNHTFLLVNLYPDFRLFRWRKCQNFSSWPISGCREAIVSWRQRDYGAWLWRSTGQKLAYSIKNIQQNENSKKVSILWVAFFICWFLETSCTYRSLGKRSPSISKKF